MQPAPPTAGKFSLRNNVMPVWVYDAIATVRGADCLCLAVISWEDET